MAIDANSTCDVCTAILANASRICVSHELRSDIASQCLDDDEGAGLFGSYLMLWRCGVNENPLALLFLVPWLFVLLAALGSTADHFLMPELHAAASSTATTSSTLAAAALRCTEPGIREASTHGARRHYLSALLRLSPDVAGVTLLAVGNGAPDVFSAIAVATGNVKVTMDLSLMLSDIVGGCASRVGTAAAAAAARSRVCSQPPVILTLQSCVTCVCLVCVDTVRARQHGLYHDGRCRGRGMDCRQARSRLAHRSAALLA